MSMAMREREIHYIFSSHLRADQMCKGSFLGILCCNFWSATGILPDQALGEQVNQSIIRAP